MYISHTCIPLLPLHPPAVASVAGRQLGDIEAGGVRRSSSHTQKTHWAITRCWQQRLGEEKNQKKDKLRQEMLMVSRGGKRGRQTISRERGWVIEKLSDGWDRSNREMMIAWWMRRRQNGEIKRDRWLDEWRQLDCASETLFILFYFVFVFTAIGGWEHENS